MAWLGLKLELELGLELVTVSGSYNLPLNDFVFSLLAERDCGWKEPLQTDVFYTECWTFDLDLGSPSL